MMITNGSELISPEYYGQNGPPHDVWTQLRAESPVWVASGKPAKRCQHAHFFVIDDLEDRLEKIQPVITGTLFEFLLGGSNLSRQFAIRFDGHVQVSLRG